MNTASPAVVAPTANPATMVPLRIRPHHHHSQQEEGKEDDDAEEHHHHSEHVKKHKPKRKDHANIDLDDSNTDDSWSSESSESDGDDLDEHSHELDRGCTATAFSLDGTLVATGFDDRLVTIQEAAYPTKAPLARFFAYGAVSAVAMGHGLRGAPWLEGH